MKGFPHYVLLTKDILVPSGWPLDGIDRLVLTLAEKIINENNSVNSILQVKDVPAKLVTLINNDDFVYVFEQVSITETVGSYLYEIVLPKEEASIRRRTFSGNSFINQSWPDYAISVSTRAQKTSYYLMPPHLDRLFVIAYKLTCEPIKMPTSITDATSVAYKGASIMSQHTEASVRRQSWTLEVSPQKRNQIWEQRKLFMRDMLVSATDSSCKVTVLRRSSSDRAMTKDNTNRS
ncbi:hypothetical protein KQX54_017167 [Cotesia glomerata]|uniref:Uncharacterized protein n=1 Tax=Cotesia glomerata TaxID=32391 RepID=A0AAV7HSR2_COTGL|nr:hypothetical protein KQX54_017167 [Cotesia glomerata]